MPDLELSHDAQKLLYSMYRCYLERRKNGIPRSTARILGSSHTIQEECAPAMDLEDIDDLCRALAHEGLLHCHFSDNRISECLLSEHGIAYLDSRFKRGLDEVLEIIGKSF